MSGDQQPTISEGPVTLRPWRDEDVEPARLAHDEEMARRFGWYPEIVPSTERMGEWIREMGEAYADGRRVAAFAIEVDAQVAGAIDVKVKDDGLGVLSWAVYPAFRGRGISSHAARMIVDFAFDALDLERLEAYVAVDNRASRATATRAGMRQEGRLRGAETLQGERRDQVLYARLRGDADPSTREGRIALANEWLPRKRVAAKVLARDESGRVLLVAGPTSAGLWDLPGGIVEPFEAPRAGAIREVREELGLDLSASIGPMLLMDWLPRSGGWDDLCLCVFDGGVQRAGILEQAVFQLTEVTAAEWVEPPEALTRPMSPVAQCLPVLLDPGRQHPTYLENHLPVDHA